MLLAKQVTGGMIPKLTACSSAVTHGVGSAHIINGNKPDGIISLAYGGETLGTTVKNTV
jgi:acetylglutamate kinase